MRAALATLGPVADAVAADVLGAPLAIVDYGARTWLDEIRTGPRATAGEKETR